MPRTMTLLLCLAALGCAQTQQAATDVKSAVQAQAAAPTLSTHDASFLNDAGRAGITAVTFGQLARAQASRAAIRDYGLRMVTDNTTINQQLTALATGKQITPTATADVAHQAAYDRIAALRGRSFDRAWLDSQFADQSATLALYRDEAATGTDPDVRAFAARTAPKLQANLDMARRLGARPTP